MKYVRTFLSLLVIGLMLSGTAWAQGDLSLGGGGDGFDLSLATVDTDTFTLSSDVSIALIEWDTTALETPLHVGANKTGYKVMQFRIYNNSGVEDTLRSISFASYNDKEFSTSKVALYRAGIASALSQIDPGEFSENDEITFADLESVIPDNDSATFYFTFDSDPTHVDTSYNALWLGLKVFGGGITLALAGQSPALLTDTLAYDTGTLGYGNTGRLVSFDTQPPHLTIDFDFMADDGGGCFGNGIVNLGDSVWFLAKDVVGDTALEIREAWADLRAFGATSDSVGFDSVYVSGTDTIGLQFFWRIPVESFTPAVDVPALAYDLIVSVADLAGNVRTDTLELPYPFDNQMPIFDSVWVDLPEETDLNGDGIAGIGDTIQLFASMTQNQHFEVQQVSVDLSGWGMGTKILNDPYGTRTWFSAQIEITSGFLDLPADTSASLFTVTAIDEACNWDTLSNQAPFAIDNDRPYAPLSFSYEDLRDVDMNGIINIGDSVVFTIDVSNTSDLGDVCELALDLYESGLGGLQMQCVEDTNVAGEYVYKHLVLEGEDGYAGDWLAGNHTVELTLTDDAGNTRTVTSDPLAQAVDTDPPEPVDDLEATLSPCAITLEWSASNMDDKRYFIFCDYGNGWEDDTVDETLADGSVVPVFLDTLGAVSAPNTTFTTGDTLTHGTTYQFIVRTIDDADNHEYNLSAVAATADCVPPTVCVDYPETGGAYGVDNEMEVIASSDDADVASARIWIRDTNVSGAPGQWKAFPVAMTRIGGGQQFKDTVTNSVMQGLFGMLTDDKTYEIIVQGIDEVGNVQDTLEAYAACPSFSFTWFYTGLDLVLLSVNGAISPQTSCGFDVTRDDANEVIFDIPGHVDGKTYTFDVYWYDTSDDYRIHYDENVTTMPYSFMLNCTNFPKGTHDIYVEVTRDDGKFGKYDFEICVPDEDAPEAMIVYPVDGQRVRVMTSMMNPVEVWARVVDWAYDPAPVTRVDFEWGMQPDLSDGAILDIETSPGFGNTYVANWDTRGFNDGDVVYLRATFYDDKNNTQATPIIQVTMDATTADIILTCPQAMMIDGCATISGYVDFYAEFSASQTWDDFETIELWYKRSSDPDIPDFWRGGWDLEPGTSENIYVYYGFPVFELDDNTSYDFRLIVTDITGNVMFDYDGDGMFDAYTFDPASWNSDAMFCVDHSPADIAFMEALAGGITFPTPSEKLGGTDRIYVPAREPITVWSQTIPMSDTSEVATITYYWDETSVGTLGPDPAAVPWYEHTFNPYELGLYTDADITDGYEYFDLDVKKTDILGREPVWDGIDVIVLDVEPSQAVILNPCWDACVWGDVELEAATLNNDDIKLVIFYYRAEGADTWIPIDSASYYWDDKDDGFYATWHTLGNVEDGTYELAAVAVDWSFNRDDNPWVTKLTVANTLPTVSITAPAENFSFVGEDEDGNGTIFKAEVGTETAVSKVSFMYKSIFSNSWYTLSTDEYPPYEAEWNNTEVCAFHFKVRAYNCADRGVDSEIMTFYQDWQDPFAIITQIAGMDAEANNDPDIDLTDMDTVRVVGMFDDCMDECNCPQSGLAKVAFELQDESGSRVFAKFIDPATSGEQSALFNISGLDDGRYRFYARAWDAVGNMFLFGPVYVYITDHTPPTTSVIGFYGNRLYGYDWDGDASRVLFEYQSGTEWVGVGAGHSLGDGFWWTELDASTIGAASDFRMMATDPSGNYSATNALVINADPNGDGLDFEDGTDLSNFAVIKNYENDNFEGVLRVEVASGEMPVALAVYETGPYEYSYETCSLDPHIGGTLYQDDVHFDNVICNGKAVFMVGAADGAGALSTEVSTFEYQDDIGTNGTVVGNGGTVEVTIPEGAGSGCLVVMETWIPRSGAQQDYRQPVGNHNGLANYIGCDYYDKAAPDAGGNLSQDAEDSYCCFDYNKYAVIKMAYDPAVTAPAESLVVMWWDTYDNEWRSDGIYYLYGDEGFDVENHTVEFSSECLYGIFTVAQIISDEDPGTINMELTDVKPWCNDYTGPYAYEYMPKFLLKVWDDYAGIDDETFEVWLNGTPIHWYGDDSDYWSTGYDRVTGYLSIYGSQHWEDEHGMGAPIPPLACGANTLTVSVYNNQANRRIFTFDFNVDCDAPNVVFDNYYVTKDPTIEFYITDLGAGVDWDSIYVDVIAVQQTNTDPGNPNQNEHLFFLGTFFPDQVQHYMVDDTTVRITTSYDLQDKRAIFVAVYDGTRDWYWEDYYWYGEDPVAYDDWDVFYHPGSGAHDCVGNRANPWFQELSVDYNGPTVMAPGEDEWNQVDHLPVTCSDIMIYDNGSGVDETSIEIYENGELIEAGDDTYSYDEMTGLLNYCPTPGADVKLIVYDGAGNITVRNWSATGDRGVADYGVAINYPNPFDPAIDGGTTIDTKFKGEVTVTIYDFAGDEVISHTTNEDGTWFWNGYTSDDEMVANGVYFAYCKTTDGRHKIVKIAVIRR